MTEDKITLGLTPDNNEVIEKIMERGIFKEKIDAAKFALSVAINKNVKPGVIEGTETVWNIGSFDPDGELRDFIPAIFPNTENPYRLIEYLINAGLEIIGAHLSEDKYFAFEELMKPSD